MTKLQLTFDTGQQVHIVPKEHDLGYKWFEHIQNSKRNGYEIREDDRIYNLNDYWTQTKIMEEIRNCVRIINDYKQFIDFETNQPTLTQDQLNYLHHHFENLIGLDGAGSEYYDGAPNHVKQAICDFNINIHRMENKVSKRMVVTFDDYKRYSLSTEELDRFNFSNVPGDVYFNYCHTGKPLVDFFRDEDEHIDVGNILPQHCWNSDFVLGFFYGPAHKSWFPDWVDQQWVKHEDHIAFNKNESRNAFGFCVVGELVGDPIKICQELYGIKKIIDYDFI